MVESSFSLEVKKFCQNTSVRGIPRIINAKSQTQSIIWLLGIVCCACILIWQLSIMCTRFFSYPVSTSYTESPPWDNTTFPDVTVCNLCPLVYEKHLNLTFADYVDILRNEFVVKDEKFKNIFQLYNNDSSQINATFSRILSNLISLTGYYRNFPVASNVYNSGPVLGCSYFNWDYTQTTAYPCMANIKMITNPDFYQCYMFTLGNFTRKAIRGLSAVIYVEDYPEIFDNPYSINLRYTRARGLQVRISTPGSSPDLKQGFPVGPGLSSQITLEQTVQTNLPDPYSGCTTQKTLGPLDPVTTYRQSYCTDTCIQSKILEKCGCLSTDFRFTSSQLSLSNHSTCGNVYTNDTNGSINWNGIKQMACVDSLSQYKNICFNSCPLPCQQYIYTPTSSSAPWPHPFMQPSFYETFIGVTAPPETFQIPENVKDKFVQYREVLDYTKPHSGNLTAAHELLTELDRRELFKNNFVQLNLQFIYNTYNVQTDSPAYSIDAFGAQIGGVLCLWLGLTIMFLFEVFELFLNIVYFCYKKARHRNNTATKEDNNPA